VHPGDIRLGVSDLGWVAWRVPDEETVILMFRAPLVELLVSLEVDHPVQAPYATNALPPQ